MRARPLVAISLILAASFSAAARQVNSDSSYPVYNAVFAAMHFPKANPLILIIAKTQSSECGDKGDGMVLMNGCGIWFPPQNPQTIYDTFSKDYPQISKSTWTSFINVNQKRFALQDHMNPPWKYEFADLSADSEHSKEKPDGVILLSSVGFNTDRSQALVYVLFLSYMPQVSTSGNLFLVKRTSSGLWQIDGRETLIETVSGN